MKRLTKVIAALALASCATVAAAEDGKWVRYWQAGDNITVYHWSRSRNHTVWQMMDLKKKDNGTQSVLRLIEAHCSLGVYAVSEVSLYPQHMGEGEVIASDRGGDVRHPGPGTADEYLYDMLCKGER